jgi:rhomboid-like protein
MALMEWMRSPPEIHSKDGRWRSGHALTGRREMETSRHHVPFCPHFVPSQLLLMSYSRITRLPLSLVLYGSKTSVKVSIRPAACSSWRHITLQTRSQHNRSPRPTQNYRQTGQSQVDPRAIETSSHREPPQQNFPETLVLEDVQWPNVKIRYLRPAIWALLVSGGIFTSLAYLEAKKELQPKKASRWLEVPQWGMQRRTAPTPTEVATQWWGQLNTMSKVSCGIIAANSAVHLTSFVAPQFWNSLWHVPARNVNYTQFTSMFVHSGPFHLFVNMYATYNFMIPVGYSRAFEGNPYQVLSFFLATGVLSGFAQHWATLITPAKRAIPEAFIKCGGASGALLGILGVFCMEYPHAGLGIMFVPVHFDAQYVLPAVMLFDFIGMVRGYSFVNFGHAASCINHNFISRELIVNRHIFPAHYLVWATLIWTGRTTSGSP